MVAFAVGYAVIAWLLRYLRTRSYLPFVIYRVALGTLVLVLLATGVLDAPSRPSRLASRRSSDAPRPPRVGSWQLHS